MADEETKYVTAKDHEHFEKRINERLTGFDQRLSTIETQVGGIHSTMRELQTSVSTIDARTKIMQDTWHDHREDFREIRKSLQQLNPQHFQTQIDARKEHSNALEKRVHSLEGRDGKRWELVIAALISGAIGFLIRTLFGG